MNFCRPFHPKKERLMTEKYILNLSQVFSGEFTVRQLCVGVRLRTQIYCLPLLHLSRQKRHHVLPSNNARKKERREKGVLCIAAVFPQQFSFRLHSTRSRASMSISILMTRRTCSHRGFKLKMAISFLPHKTLSYTTRKKKHPMCIWISDYINAIQNQLLVELHFRGKKPLDRIPLRDYSSKAVSSFFPPISCRLESIFCKAT